MPIYSPAEVAAITLRMTGGQADLDAVAGGYIRSAQRMREYASKAASSPKGLYRGYTSERALKLAAESDARAITVPAEMRKLMGL